MFLKFLCICVAVVDYVLARKKDMKDVKDVKVIPSKDVSQNISWL